MSREIKKWEYEIEIASFIINQNKNKDKFLYCTHSCFKIFSNRFTIEHLHYFSFSPSCLPYLGWEVSGSVRVRVGEKQQERAKKWDKTKLKYANTVTLSWVLRTRVALLVPEIAALFYPSGQKNISHPTRKTNTQNRLKYILYSIQITLIFIMHNWLYTKEYKWTLKYLITKVLKDIPPSRWLDVRQKQSKKSNELAMIRKWVVTRFC